MKKISSSFIVSIILFWVLSQTNAIIEKKSKVQPNNNVNLNIVNKSKKVDRTWDLEENKQAIRDNSTPDLNLHCANGKCLNNEWENEDKPTWWRTGWRADFQNFTITKKADRPMEVISFAYDKYVKVQASWNNNGWIEIQNFAQADDDKHKNWIEILSFSTKTWESKNEWIAIENLKWKSNFQNLVFYKILDNKEWNHQKWIEILSYYNKSNKVLKWFIEKEKFYNKDWIINMKYVLANIIVPAEENEDKSTWWRTGWRADFQNFTITKKADKTWNLKENKQAILDPATPDLVLYSKYNGWKKEKINSIKWNFKVWKSLKDAVAIRYTEVGKLTKTYKKSFSKIVNKVLNKFWKDKLSKLEKILDIKIKAIKSNKKYSLEQKEKKLAIYWAVNELISDKINGIK